jgi:hypothetical protein
LILWFLGLAFRAARRGPDFQESEFFMKNIRSMLLLFLGVCLSALAGAQASTKLAIFTDMDCNWNLDGQPMDPLKAGDYKVIPVSPGEHLIQAASTDGVATNRIQFNTTILTKMDVDMGEFWVSIELKPLHDTRPKKQNTQTAGELAEAALNPTWTDPATGLMWTKKDNGSIVDWNQADAYCSNLQLAGYKDWRLPAVEELQGIYDASVSVRKAFDTGETYNVHVKGNLMLTGWDWSSNQGDAPGKGWQMAWGFNFGGFGVKEQRVSFPLKFDFNSRALCVRRSDSQEDRPATH